MVLGITRMIHSILQQVFSFDEYIPSIIAITWLESVLSILVTNTIGILHDTSNLFLKTTHFILFSIHASWQLSIAVTTNLRGIELIHNLTIKMIFDQFLHTFCWDTSTSNPLHCWMNFGTTLKYAFLVSIFIFFKKKLFFFIVALDPFTVYLCSVISFLGIPKSSWDHSIVKLL